MSRRADKAAPADAAADATPGKAATQARVRQQQAQHTRLLKDAILNAAISAGDGDLSAYLELQARNVPVPFMTLLGKVLPLQAAKEDGAARTPTTIHITIVDPQR